MGKISKQEISSGLKAEIESKAKQEDLTNLEQEIAESLSETVKKSQVSTSVTSASTTNVASSSAVKTAYDRANQAFQSVSNGKTLVGGAITDVDSSVVIPTDPTFQQLADAIGSISTGKKWASGEVYISSITTPINPNLTFIPTLFVVVAYNKVITTEDSTLMFFQITFNGLTVSANDYFPNKLFMNIINSGNVENINPNQRTFSAISYDPPDGGGSTRYIGFGYANTGGRITDINKTSPTVYIQDMITSSGSQANYIPSTLPVYYRWIAIE